MISFWILILLLRQSEGVHHPHVHFSDDYTYSVKDLERGPTTWGGDCLLGSNQSPIDIRYRDHGVGWGYTKIWFNALYRKTQPGFYFTNVGHTFQIQLVGNIREPTSHLVLSGAGLESRYTFAQLHFHWGDRDELGSEHTLQGIRYPMEIHFVHYKSKYGNLSHALSQNYQDSSAVTVLSILCELGPENPALSPIVDAAKLKTLQNPSHKLMFSHKLLNLRELLPKSLDFVRYTGSLTTPPCSEKVAWTVFLCPVSISREQLETFRRLHDPDGREYYNYRPLQPRNGRHLKYYKVPETSERGGVSNMITKTLGNTLKEINSLFANIINVLGEVKHCEEDKDNLVEVQNKTLRKFH